VDQYVNHYIESFLLFSQPIPSRSLGFVDQKSSEISVSVCGKDYSIRQAPNLLLSNRKDGTTGAGKLVSSKIGQADLLSTVASDTTICGMDGFREEHLLRGWDFDRGCHRAGARVRHIWAARSRPWS
jgi:hypothetical protein